MQLQNITSMQTVQAKLMSEHTYWKYLMGLIKVANPSEEQS